MSNKEGRCQKSVFRDKGKENFFFFFVLSSRMKIAHLDPNSFTQASK